MCGGPPRRCRHWRQKLNLESREFRKFSFRDLNYAFGTQIAPAGRLARAIFSDRVLYRAGQSSGSREKLKSYRVP